MTNHEEHALAAFDLALSWISDDQPFRDEFLQAYRSLTCPDCKGSGLVVGFKCMVACPTCKGKGWKDE